MTRSDNRASWIIALLILLAPLPFLSVDTNDNMLTRMMLTVSIVEDGTTRIDPYAERTFDKSLYQGHYYSDKAPGIAFMAIPSYIIGRELSSAMGHDLAFFPDLGAPESPANEIARTMVLRFVILMTSGIMTAAAGAMFFRFAKDVSGDPKTGFLATASIFLASPLLGWSAQLFGHAVAASALFLAFYHCFYLRPDSNRAAWRALGAGAFLGIAILIEYVAAPAVALIAGYGIFRLSTFKRARAIVLLGLALLACAAFILPILLYHSISFGGMLNTGYSNVVGFDGMDEGFMGLTYPKPMVLLLIIFGFRRGIFWLSPLLALVPYGAWKSLHSKFLRDEIILSVLVIIYYLLLNASYHYWHGSASTGPRHIVPSLPFMGVCIIWMWKYATGWVRTVMYLALTMGIAISLACVSVTMTAWGGFWFPLKDPILEAVFFGTNTLETHRVTLEWYRILGWSPWAVAAVWTAAVVMTCVLCLRVIRRD